MLANSALCLLLVAAVASARQDAINDLVVSEVDRKVDISTHLVKITGSYVLENAGKASTGYFLVPIDESLQNYLSFFGASVNIRKNIYKIMLIGQLVGVNLLL